ncbi:MAG: restriction endonuclease PLD domain-containing protein [archaeon]
MMYIKNLSNLIFSVPTEFVDELIIISGYLGPSQVETSLRLGINVRILYGMVASQGISKPFHESFCNLDGENRNLEIFYSLAGKEVHSKCYIWRYKGKIIKALIGSANFTNSGLNTPNKEILIDVDKNEFEALSEYIKLIFSSERIEKCTNHSLKTKIKAIASYLQTDPSEIIIAKEGEIIKTIRLSLLDRSGEVPKKSGLNWGHSDGNVKPNDAYIKISKGALRTTFFKPKDAKQTPIDAVWDDGETMAIFEEGNQKYDGTTFPKQLASAKSKEIMGKYLRKRLKVPLDHKITLKDLKKYGRTHIDVTITAPNSYYLDFSN